MDALFGIERANSLREKFKLQVRPEERGSHRSVRAQLTHTARHIMISLRDR
jgi:hypothetical protein